MSYNQVWGVVMFYSKIIFHSCQGDLCWFVVYGDGGGVFEATVEKVAGLKRTLTSQIVI